MHASAQNEIEIIAEKLAQEQLDAYNNRDIEAFVLPYAENVKVFNFPSELLYEGREKMYDLYGRMFARTPDLYCKLVNRMVMGNTVIDQEEVTITKNEPPMRAIAIYKIVDGKIAEVYFVRE
ncbi:nuclear transport factor 2 family protein [Aquiflexum lacus]|uniref:nuclear transport factor 2 family protein n=1 Tax=Aquiflexum lacus TaxID=2483805 RepID=UPI0018934EA0|nr:nuclear transport factor 2 family protein [Aquiflexum lacus]